MNFISDIFGNIGQLWSSMPMVAQIAIIVIIIICVLGRGKGKGKGGSSSGGSQGGAS